MASTHEDNLLYTMPPSGSSYLDEWFDFDNSFDFQMPSISFDDVSITFADSTSPPMGNGNEIDPKPKFTLDVNSEVVPHPEPSQSSSLDFAMAENGCDANSGDAFVNWSPPTWPQASDNIEESFGVHLQDLRNLQDATDEADRGELSYLNTRVASSCWSDFVQDLSSPEPQSTSVSPSSHSAETVSTPSSVANPVPCHGVEMVLDKNMNVATNLPRKQKPRSLAQKESYVKVRKYGACDKHRKQHKRVSLFLLFFWQLIPFISSYRY